MTGLDLNMTGLVLNMTGFFLNVTGFVLNTTGFASNMTRFVVNMTGLVLNMTEFFLNRTGFVLNTAPAPAVLLIADLQIFQYQPVKPKSGEALCLGNFCRNVKINRQCSRDGQSIKLKSGQC